MRKKHPLDVYCSGRPFQGSNPNASLAQNLRETTSDSIAPDGEGASPSSRKHSWRRGWRPKAMFGSCAAVALLGLVWAGSWAYTGEVWPDVARSGVGNPQDELQTPWPDRRNEEGPGGGSPISNPEAEYVLRVISGRLPEELDERRRILERWEYDQRRLQERLDERFPDYGLVVSIKLIAGQDNVVGLFVLRWYEEDDAELIQVRQWVQQLERRFAQATVHQERSD